MQGIFSRSFAKNISVGSLPLFRYVSQSSTASNEMISDYMRKQVQDPDLLPNLGHSIGSFIDGQWTEAVDTIELCSNVTITSHLTEMIIL